MPDFGDMQRRPRFARLALGAFLAAFAGLVAGAPTDEGYSNVYPHDPKASFWLWKWEQLRHGVPDPPPGGWRIPHVKADAPALRTNASRPTVTWIGHATFLVQLGGQNILIDAHFSERASPVPFAGPRRIVPLPIDIPELPRIDVVLTSTTTTTTSTSPPCAALPRRLPARRSSSSRWG